MQTRLREMANALLLDALLTHTYVRPTYLMLEIGINESLGWFKVKGTAKNKLKWNIFNLSDNIMWSVSYE